ncbi:MAG: spermidine synthase [Betaproteobacteria bacterium]
MKIRKSRHSIEISEEAGVRFLHFGSDWIQGAMRVRKPHALELEYTREMLTCLLWRDWTLWPRQVLLIGLGAGSLVKFLYLHLPRASLQVVEIDSRIPPFAQANFDLPDDSGRIETTIGDGSAFVRESPRRYDLILVDGFDHRARAGPLDSPAFYRDCLERLAPGGVMATNLFGNTRGFDKSLHRVDDAFAGKVVVLPPGKMGNVIVFGLESPGTELTLADLRERARLFNDETGLNLRPTLKRMVVTGMLPSGALWV